MKINVEKKDFFAAAISLSLLVHGLLVVAGGGMSLRPAFSVLQAPSSLEVTVVSRPVVSVLEDQIVSERIGEAAEQAEKGPGPRVQIPASFQQASSAPSQESQGALTKARPLPEVNLAPPYPRVARQKGWEGTVRVNVLVSEDGTPSQVGIEESSGYGVLDQAALKAVARWKFLPAQSGVIRLSSKITIPIQFALIKE